MSLAHVTFGVSEPFCNHSDYSPIHCAKSTRECFDNVRRCLGETIQGNARFNISPTAMAAGGYGQEASFIYDPSQRNEAGSTIANLHRAVAEVERAVWNDDVEQAENQERIRRIIAGYYQDPV